MINAALYSAVALALFAGIYLAGLAVLDWMSIEMPELPGMADDLPAVDTSEGVRFVVGEDGRLRYIVQMDERSRLVCRDYATAVSLDKIRKRRHA